MAPRDDNYFLKTTMEYKKIDNQFVIRIVRGEGIVEQLKIFCQKERVEGGFFFGLGAVDQVELADYIVNEKKYLSQKFTGSFELTNITGSIGVEKELIVHAHATLSNIKMKAFAGHLVEARVSGTVEIFLTILPRLNKKFDEETGLKLFDLIK